MHKPSGRVLELDGRGNGLMGLGFWQQDPRRGDLIHAPFRVEAADRRQIHLSGVAGLWFGWELDRTVSLSASSSAIEVRDRIRRNQESFEGKPNLYFDQVFPGRGSFQWATEAGVVARQSERGEEVWTFNPAQSWASFVRDDGLGTVFVFDFANLRGLFLRSEESQHLGWLTRRIRALPDQPVEFRTTIAPFTALGGVTGAARFAAGELQVRAKGHNGEHEASLKLAAFQPGTASLQWAVEDWHRSRRVELGTEAISLEPGFERKPEIVSFRPPPSGGVLIAKITLAGEAPLFLEQPIHLGSGVYQLRPPEEKPALEPADSPTWNRARPLDLDFCHDVRQLAGGRWSGHWAAGRPRVLALLPEGSELEGVELAERFDIELGCAFLVSTPYYALGDAVRRLSRDDLRRHVAGQLARRWDAIVMSAPEAWGLLDEGSRQKLLEQIKQGTGLVLLGRGAAPSDLAPVFPFHFKHFVSRPGGATPVGGPGSLLSALPWTMMSMPWRASAGVIKGGSEIVLELASPLRGQPIPLFATGTLGKGRLVASWAGGRLIPAVLDVADQRRQRELPGLDEWEYHYAALAKLIYRAAKKESSVRINSVELDGEAALVTVSSPVPASFSATFRLRDAFGGLLVTSHAVIRGDAKGEANYVPLASKVPGAIVEVLLTGPEGVLDFGAGSIHRRGPRIQRLVLRPRHDTLSADLIARFAEPPPATATVEWALLGPGNRIIATGSQPAQTNNNIPVPLDLLEGSVVQARVTVLDQREVLDAKATTATLAVQRRPDRYRPLVAIGLDNRSSVPVIARTLERFRELGFNGVWVNEQNIEPTAIFLQARGMAYNRDATSIGTERGITKVDRERNGGRTACALHDPEARNRQVEKARRSALAHKDEDVLMFSTGDESRGPGMDKCFCDASLAAFRSWLQARYRGRIADLNKAWATRYRSFGEVTPLAEAEARPYFSKTRTSAPWLEHRLFAFESVAMVTRDIKQGLVEGDPSALLGASGTQETTPASARDWFLLSPLFGALASYSGTQTAEQRSFNPEAVRYPWVGYGKSNPIFRQRAYRALMEGARGFTVFTGRNVVDPNLTLSEQGRDIRGTLAELKKGIGQLMTSAQLPTVGVYLLQSTPSVLGAEALGMGKAAEAERRAWSEALSLIVPGHQAIADRQVEAGELSKRQDARVLILPRSVALSPTVKERVGAWVEQGGRLVTDPYAGLMDGHGRLFERSPFDRLLGMDRRGGFMGLEAAVSVERSLGKGKVIVGEFATRWFQAFDSPQVDGSEARAREWRTRIEGILQEAGVQPEVQLLSPVTGAPVTWARVITKHLGEARLVWVQRDDRILRAEVADEAGSLVLKEEAEIYDVVDAMHLGRGQRVPLRLVNDTGRLFALLPSRARASNVPTELQGSRGQRIELKLSSCSIVPSVLHIQLFAPDGEPATWFERDFVTQSDDGVRVSIPFALNDQTGRWRLRVVDPLCASDQITDVMVH